MSTSKDILLGSGDLYMMSFNGEIPSDELIETEENMVGGIKGGAKIAYTPTIYSVTDDMRRIKKSYITAEEATFESGFLTFDLGDMAKIALGSTLTEDTELGIETLEVGGSSLISEYVLRFVHTLNNGKKVRVTMIGVPNEGFELAFDPEKESVIGAKFSAVPMGAESRLFKIVKEI